MKQALSLLLTLALLLCFVPVASAADYSGATAFAFSDDGIAVTEGEATGYKISGTALTIPGVASASRMTSRQSVSRPPRIRLKSSLRCRRDVR